MRYSREDKFNPETKMFESSEYSWHLEQVSDDCESLWSGRLRQRQTIY